MVPSSFILGGARPWRADQCAAGPDPRHRDVDRAFRDGPRSFLAQAIAAACRYSDCSVDRRSLAARARTSRWRRILRDELARIPGRARRRPGYEAARLAGNVRACACARLSSRHSVDRLGIRATVERTRSKARTIFAGLGDRLPRLSRGAVVEARHLHGADDVSGVGARGRKRCRRGERPRQATEMACVPVLANELGRIAARNIRRRLCVCRRMAVAHSGPRHPAHRCAVHLERAARARGRSADAGPRPASPRWVSSRSHCSAACCRRSAKCGRPSNYARRLPLVRQARSIS